jgi:hypothetical protein
MHSINAPSAGTSTSLRTRGIIYCQKLMHQGVPYSEARSIASAIAKFEVLQKIPSPKHKQLIMKNSVLICRAHLWRPNLLLANQATGPTLVEA